MFQVFLKTGWESYDDLWKDATLLAKDEAATDGKQEEKAENFENTEAESTQQTDEPSQLSKAGKATARLRNFACVVESGTLPVEDVQSLHSYHGLIEMIESCKTMATELEMQRLTDVVEQQTQQVLQLWSCMKTAVKDSHIALLI